MAPRFSKNKDAIVSPYDDVDGKSKGKRRLGRKGKILIFLLVFSLLTYLVTRKTTNFVKLRPKQEQQPLPSRVDQEKSDFVKEMMLHAWNGYYTKAKHCDEVNSVQGTCHNWDNHADSLSLSAIDALDTLLLMGLENEYKQARNIVNGQGWDIDVSISFFEMVIRGIGGLLSAYDLTLDRMFLEKATKLMERLWPAFDDNLDGGLPWSRVNLRHGHRGDNPFLSGNMYLAEVATLQLELEYLSLVTGIEKYATKSRWINQWLNKKRSTIPVRGVWPRDLTKQGNLIGSHYTVGAGLDSFLEYLLKLWVWQGRPSKPPSYDPTPLREMYDEAARGMMTHLAHTTHPSENVTHRFFSNANIAGKSFNPDGTLEHLACFAGGMLALGVHTWPGWGEDASEEDIKEQKQLAKWADYQSRACAATYLDSPLGLGAERSDMTQDPIRPSTISTFVRVYLLRPETIESLFYMWRFTHKQVYRDLIWTIVQNLNRECRVAHGFSGVADVSVDPSQKRYTNVQESYFLAETLKYAWLAFQDDDVLDLDKVVFNTEAHPLSIRPIVIERMKGLKIKNS